MTTVIKAGNAMTGEKELRVTESVTDVADELNMARSQNHRFVAFTDAETGKQITVDPASVHDVREE